MVFHYLFYKKNVSVQRIDEPVAHTVVVDAKRGIIRSIHLDECAVSPF